MHLLRKKSGENNHLERYNRAINNLIFALVPDTEGTVSNGCKINRGISKLALHNNKFKAKLMEFLNSQIS